VNDKVDAEVIDRLSAMQIGLVAMRCAGYDNVDLAACTKNKTSVTRVPAYSPYAVAEFAVTLMLTLNRKVHRAYAHVRDANFSLTGLVGFDMRGKTVGVLGTGKIGMCALDVLIGFGCKTLCYDVFQNDQVAKKGSKYVTLDELFAQCDIITIHVPLLPSTHHMINKESIAKMKDGVMLINTSRGPLIDNRALLEGVLSGKLGSVGLDVYEGESEYFFEDRSTTNIKDDILARLVSLHNVIVTGHQAFLTSDALEAIAESTLSSISEYVHGKRLNELTNAVKQEYK